MAIARGAGTEIIRTALFEQLTGDGLHTLIIGEQHHIYTVLSVIVCCTARADAGHVQRGMIIGYDSEVSGTGGSGVEHWLWSSAPAAGETYVWNDKFSFNGTEPTAYTGPLSTTAEQDLIVDQATTTAQILKIYTNANSTDYDVTLTYIDQNNN